MFAQRRRAFGQTLEVLLEAAVQMPVSGAAGHQPTPSESREGMRYRGALGAHDLTQQSMSQWQRQADAGGLDTPPTSRQVPEQERQADLEPRLTRDRSQDVDVGDPATGTAQQSLKDLRPRSRPVGETPVEKREPRRAQSPPGIDALQQDIVSPAVRLQEISRTDDLNRSPVVHSSLDGDQSVEDQQTQPVPDRLEPRS